MVNKTADCYPYITFWLKKMEIKAFSAQTKKYL
jgi:hypothetical protein